MQFDDGEGAERVLQQSARGWTQGIDTEPKEIDKVQLLRRDS